MNIKAVAASFVLSFLTIASVFGFQDPWTSFQNGGSPVLTDLELPVEWSPEKGVAWELKLAGYGQSTPVLFQDQVYVTTVSGEQKEKLHIQAISIQTGEQVWHHEAANSTPEKNSTYVSRAAPTPVCDEDGVIAFFEGGNVIALTHAGDVRWEIDLVQENGNVKARHSLGASLEQNEDHVFIWIERENDPYVLAVNKATGETVWRSAGVGSTSWASPRLLPVGDSEHLVLSASGKIVGLDPQTGKHLWEFDQVGGNSTPTPMVAGNGRFLVGASPGRGNSDSGNASKSNGMIKVAQEGEAFKATWAWQAERATSSFGSPVVVSGKAYFVNRQGVVFCLDVESGKEIYAKRIPAGSVWATPVALGSNLYFFGKDGVTTVVNSTADSLDEIATNDLWVTESARESTGEGGGNFGGPVLYAATPHSSGLLLRRGDVLYFVAK